MSESNVKFALAADSSTLRCLLLTMRIYHHILRQKLSRPIHTTRKGVINCTKLRLIAAVMLHIHRNYPEFYIEYQNVIIIGYSKHIKDIYIFLICIE